LAGRSAGFDKIKIKWQFSCNAIIWGYASSGSLVHCWPVRDVRYSIYYLTGAQPSACATTIVCRWVLSIPSQER